MQGKRIANGSESLPQRIKADILARLASGWLMPNAKFPSEQSIADGYGVSRITARHAILDLINNGVLTRESRKGTYVAEIQEKATVSDSKELNAVLLIVPDLGISYYYRVIDGIYTTLRRSGYDIVLRLTSDDSLLERNYLETAESMGIKGVILIGQTYTGINVDAIRNINARLPFVMLDISIDEAGCDTVHSDDVHGAYLVTKHLIELGHRRIAHLAAVDDRLAGYTQALEEKGLAYDPELVRQTNWAVEEGYSETYKLMLNNRDVTAIFAANDALAAGAYKALVDLGLSVPGQVALAGYGDTSMAKHAAVPLTTVNQEPVKAGHEAARLLIEKMLLIRPLSAVENIVVPVRLIVRQSCGIKEALEIAK